MNVLNTYLTKRASLFPYQVATGGPGAAYYNEGGNLGQVATYNKAPLAGMNFHDLAYTVNDAALWGVPPIFKAPQMLSKVPKLGKFGVAVYNAYNKTPYPIKNMAYNTSIVSLPYLGAEYIGMNGIVGSPAPKGVVGRYGIPTVKYGYNQAGDYLQSQDYRRYIGPLYRMRPRITPIITSSLPHKIPSLYAQLFSRK